MLTSKNPFRPILIAITVLLIVSVTSGCASAIQTLPAVEGSRTQNGPTKTPRKTKTPNPVKPLLSTDTPLPIDTPNPVSTPATVAQGLTRNNPYPASTLVSAPNWDIQVLEFKRGDAAWQDIQAANSFNEPAPEGMEYLLVKLHVKSKYTDADQHSISGCDFAVTGDHLIDYTCGMSAEMDPSLDAELSAGEESEGWASYLIAKGEKNLILVFQELLSLDENSTRYIALDKGASIRISSDLANIKPTDLGKTRDAPAPRAQKLISQDWELSITDVVRGPDAWTMLQEANPYNDPPADGMEYIAVKIHVRSIGTADKPASIDASLFTSTGSAGVTYDQPSASAPDPALEISLFPGGQYDGWLVLQAAQAETGMMLVFNPSVDGTNENQRFISLEP